MALGYDATTVDAGYEWVGIHAVGDENETFELKGLNWWQNLFPSFRPCAILSNTPFDVPGYELVRENPSAYRQYLVFGPAQPLYLYGAASGGLSDAAPGRADVRRLSSDPWFGPSAGTLRPSPTCVRSS